MGGERADTGNCPAGETCSPETPDGLDFVGTQLGDETWLGGPLATAIGGTQEIALDVGVQPLEYAYTVDDNGGQGVRFDQQNGNVVTVTGDGSFENYLRILAADDGELFDRKLISGAQVDAVELHPSTLETVPSGMPIVFPTGTNRIVVALGGQVQESTGPAEERVIDTSMSASLAGATRPAWDTFVLPDATAGDYAMSVAAGNLAAMALTVSVVDGVDAIAPIDPSQALAPDGELCFAATNNGRYVANLAWSFVVNSVAMDADANCVETGVQSGAVHVTATAGGQTATFSTTITQAATRHARAPRPTTAGERAAM